MLESDGRIAAPGCETSSMPSGHTTPLPGDGGGIIASGSGKRKPLWENPRAAQEYHAVHQRGGSFRTPRNPNLRAKAEPRYLKIFKSVRSGTRPALKKDDSV